MSMQLLLNQHVDNTPPPPPLLTNDRGVCEQTTVPGCAQTTLAALAKRQFGGLKRHLCHTLELGNHHQNLQIIQKILGFSGLLRVSTFRFPSSRVWQGCHINHHLLKTLSYENGHKCRIVQPSVVASIWSYNPHYRST